MKKLLTITLAILLLLTGFAGRHDAHAQFGASQGTDIDMALQVMRAMGKSEEEIEKVRKEFEEAKKKMEEVYETLGLGTEYADLAPLQSPYLTDYEVLVRQTPVIPPVNVLIGHQHKVVCSWCEAVFVSEAQEEAAHAFHSNWGECNAKLGLWSGRYGILKLQQGGESYTPKVNYQLQKLDYLLTKNEIVRLECALPVAIKCTNIYENYVKQVSKLQGGDHATEHAKYQLDLDCRMEMYTLWRPVTVRSRQSVKKDIDDATRFFRTRNIGFIAATPILFELYALRYNGWTGLSSEAPTAATQVQLRIKIEKERLQEIEARLKKSMSSKSKARQAAEWRELKEKLKTADRKKAKEIRKRVKDIVKEKLKKLNKMIQEEVEKQLEQAEELDNLESLVPKPQSAVAPQVMQTTAQGIVGNCPELPTVDDYLSISSEESTASAVGEPGTKSLDEYGEKLAELHGSVAVEQRALNAKFFDETDDMSDEDFETYVNKMEATYDRAMEIDLANVRDAISASTKIDDIRAKYPNQTDALKRDAECYTVWCAHISDVRERLQTKLKDAVELSAEDTYDVAEEYLDTAIDVLLLPPEGYAEHLQKLLAELEEIKKQ